MTTKDAERSLIPDDGRIAAYHGGSGFDIRHDVFGRCNYTLL